MFKEILVDNGTSNVRISNFSLPKSKVWNPQARALEVSPSSVDTFSSKRLRPVQ